MQLFDLTGKTALITGASSGLGAQCARCLSRAGARVILAARRKKKLEALAAELNNALAIEMDVSDKNSVSHAFKVFEQSEERIDICINNAGIGKKTEVFAKDPDSLFEATIQTNLTGAWYVAKATAQHMKTYEIPGSIVNIASINGANALREGLTGYASSKAGVIQMTKALVGELAHHHIRINCILPGLFHTPMTDDRLNTQEGKAHWASIIPLGFVADPSDLDGAILLLASNAASKYMTGSCLTIDGGISWGGHFTSQNS